MKNDIEFAHFLWNAAAWLVAEKLRKGDVAPVEIETEEMKAVFELGKLVITPKQDGRFIPFSVRCSFANGLLTEGGASDERHISAKIRKIPPNSSIAKEITYRHFSKFVEEKMV